ncbi:MAG: methyltransferase domain-containing protein [Proteobacteria bacterium]|nr:methyltransferase domain-containing protein [Pseudomonadota bacterium]NBP16379.1 methyltransferase domain-containing protein [bacterium]
MIEIEPHLKLVEYFNITQTFTSNLTPDIFYNNGEHYNVLSDINQNIFLLRQLAELNFLKKSNWVCDCGLGLGNALYDIYLQSNEIEFDFQFVGIEKQSTYVNFIKQNLSHLWSENFNLHNCDLMDFDYSKFNIVYSYSPFNNWRQLKSMYQKIISEIKPGSIIIEHSNRGLGHFQILTEFTELEKHDLECMSVFRKI